MNKKINKNLNHFLFRKNLPWFLFSFALFFLITLSVLVQKEMGSDGGVYASIAWNMAHNIGSLWHPVYTPSVVLPVHTPSFFPPFYEHPSLSMYIHSLFFRLFGDNFIVDSVYCLFTLLLSLWATVLIWYQLESSSSRHLLWLVLFCWVAVPLTTRTYASNAIEDLLTMFTTFSVWASLRALLNPQKIGILCMLFASACISAAFFSNGLQAFFPLLTPLIYHCVFRKHTWKIILSQTFFLIFFTALMLWAVLSYHPAYAFIRQYLSQQVIATFTHARIGNGNYRGFSHLIGIPLILVNLLPLFFVIGVVFAVWAKKSQKTFSSVMKENTVNKNALFFLLIGLSASLPVLASSRQMMHYFLQAYPFFILMCLAILTPIMARWISCTNIHAAYYKKILIFTGAFFIATSIMLVKLYGREAPMLQEVNMISTLVPNNSAISVNPTLFQNWNLHTYFYRYHQIALTKKTRRAFLSAVSK